MAYIKFPDFLPKPQLSGYTIVPGTSIVTTSIPTGYKNQKKLGSVPPDKLAIVWFMTKEQLGVFKFFFQHKLNGGADWFSMFHLSNPTNTSESGWVQGNFRFSESPAYKVTNLGYLNFSVSSTLTRQKKEIISESQYNLKINEAC